MSAGLTVAAGLSACDPGNDRAGTDEALKWRDGPAASWTLTVSTGEHQVANVGNVVVVTDEQVLLGLDQATGIQRWRRETSGPYTITIANGLIVQETKDGPLEVLDPATGSPRWQDNRTGWTHVIRRDVVYADNCASQATAGQRDCTIESHEVEDGRIRWTIPAIRGVRDDRISSHKPYAPESGAYVLAGTGTPELPFGAVDTRTGQVLAGHIRLDGWHAFAAGDTLVSTDHDPPKGDRKCTVTVTAAAADTGAARWTGAVYSGRRTNGDCAKTLANRDAGAALIGSGALVAAVTAEGRPQVVDLSTGRTVWVGTEQGSPIDGDASSVLVRRQADEGSMTLFDLKSGRSRWSTEDPGLSGQSASWSSMVNSRLVAVSGAAGERPYVLVYDVDSGRRLGRFPSWLAGAGDDWVAVTRSAEQGKLTLELIRFDQTSSPQASPR